MKPETIQQLTAITATLGFITALLALVSNVFNRSALKKIHIDINSRITELLLEKGKASFQEGRREGVESQIK